MLVILRKHSLLCDDLCLHILEFVTTRRCARCGCVTETAHHVHACFVGGQRLCFTCHHRARWPCAAT